SLRRGSLSCRATLRSGHAASRLTTQVRAVLFRRAAWHCWLGRGGGKMPLMDDYRGDFDPDFELARLSRRALVVLAREYMLAAHLQDRAGLPQVLIRHRGDPRQSGASG